MVKVNIANYTVYDLQNRFNCIEHSDIDKEIINIVADNWHKKHFVSGNKDIKHTHNDHIVQKFLI